MLRKVLLTGFIVAVFLPACVLAFEHFRGKRQLAETIARLTALGERLDIAAIVPPPPHPASNGIERLRNSTGKLDEASRFHPPAMRCVAPAQAIPTAHLKAWDRTARTNVSWSDVSAWITDHEEDLAEIRAALAYPECRASLDYAAGFKLLLPHLSQLKSACIALSTHAALASRSGDLNEALADLRAMGRTTAALDHEPIVISHLVRTALVTITLNRAWDILHSRAWTDADLVRLDASLPTDSLLQASVSALEGERALGLLTVRQLDAEGMAEMVWNPMGTAAGTGAGTLSFSMPDNLDDATELASELTSALAMSIRKHVLQPLWIFAYGDQATCAYLEGIQSLLTTVRKAAHDRRLPPGSPPNTLPFENPTTRSPWSRDSFAQNALAAIERTHHKAFIAEVQRDLLRTDIALQRFHLRHGRFPDSLSALVPDFLPSIPIDSIDGQPIRYRLDDHQRPILWSVGDNRVDDGGDALNTNPEGAGYATYFWWRSKDGVWPLPMTPEDAARWEAAEESRLQRKTTQTSQSGTPTRFKMSAELMKRYGLLPVEAPPNPPSNTNGSPAPQPR